MARNGGHTNSLFILKPLSGLQDTVVGPSSLLSILAGTIGGKLDVYSISLGLIVLLSWWESNGTNGRSM